MKDYRPVKCRNCGKPLKAAVSVARGFGPTCGLVWADKWIRHHPTYLGEKARKVWTKEEIKSLMRSARAIIRTAITLQERRYRKAGQ